MPFNTFYTQLYTKKTIKQSGPTNSFSFFVSNCSSRAATVVNNYRSGEKKRKFLKMISLHPGVRELLWYVLTLVKKVYASNTERYCAFSRSLLYQSLLIPYIRVVCLTVSEPERTHCKSPAVRTTRSCTGQNFRVPRHRRDIWLRIRTLGGKNKCYQ